MKTLPSQNSHQPLLAQDSKKSQRTQSVKSSKSLGGGGGGGGGRTKPGDTPPHSSLKDGHLKGDGGKPLPRGRSEDRAAKRKDKVEKNNRNSM